VVYDFDSTNASVRLCSNDKSEWLLFLEELMLLREGSSIRESAENVDSHSAVEQPNVAADTTMLYVSGKTRFRS